MHSGPGYDFEGTDRFQVVRRLGGGGMGVVYEAHDRERNTRVALKTLRTLDGNAVLRFKNEFRWLQDLQHPNLVSFGELFSQDGQWFFTMELVDGVDFIHWVRPSDAGADVPSGPIDLHASPLAVTDVGPAPIGRTLTPNEGRAMFAKMSTPLGVDVGRLRDALAQLARGLHVLHQAGKVHRDIKPSNILVTHAGRVVLLDFGLAKQVAASGVHSDTHVVGTVDYMAPEQAASKPVGPEADWYSMGVILYEALTGRLPFQGPPLEILMNKQARTPPPPRQLKPGLPEDLDQLCVELLRPDPGERPNGPEVLRRLGADGEEGQPHHTSSHPNAPFVGRREELSALEKAFEDSQKGAPVTIYVQGESGVGKSALARHFVEALEAAGSPAVVLAGRCYERESVPYKAFDGVVDALSRYLARLPKAEAAALLPQRASLLAQVFPVLRRVEAVAQAPLGRSEAVSPQEQRQRVFAALRELLTRMAQRRPLVLVIDDLQWADADSLALLGEVMRPGDAPALLLIGTVRISSESSSSGSGMSLALGNAVSGDVRHVYVQRLPPEEARALTALLLGKSRDPSGEGAAAIAEEAGGHPLFIDELVRHVTLGETHGPLRLDEALWSRVNRLEAPVRQLLELVVVAGAPLAQEVAAGAASMDFGEFGKRVAQLRVANLVRTTGARRSDAVETYHDRVREAVLQHLHVQDKRRWHERLALALEAVGRADPEALSIHWRGAGDGERAAHYAALAAKQAAQALAFARAARLYRLAIELRPIEGAVYQAALGGVLANAGRGGDAAVAFLEAAKGAASAEALDLQRKAAEQLLFSGHVDEGLRALKRVLAALKLDLPETPRAALMSLLWQRAQLRLRGLRWRVRPASEIPPAQLTKLDLVWAVGLALGLVDNVRGADYQSRHTLLALKSGEPLRVLRGICSEVSYLSGLADDARASRILRAADALADDLKVPYGRGLADLTGGIHHFLGSRWKPALERLVVAEEIFREKCTGVAWEVDTTWLMSLFCQWWLGDLSGLLERAPAILRSAVERGDLYGSTNVQTAIHMVHLLRDDPARASAESSDGIRKWSQQGFHVQHYYDLYAQVQCALYRGEPEEGLKLLSGGWRDMEESYLLRVKVVRQHVLELKARVLLASAALDPGERTARLAEAESIAATLERMGWPATDAHAQMIRAAQAASRGDQSRAVTHLDQAIELYQKAHMRLYVRSAKRQRGRLIGGDEGKAAIAECNDWLLDEGVRSPARLCAMIAPGFPDW